MRGARPGLRLPFTVAAGAIGGVLWLLAELTVTLAFRGHRITGIGELAPGLLGLMPAWLLLALPLGALGGLLVGRAEARTFALELAGVMALAALVLGLGVSGGRHLSSPLVRGGFSLALALIAGGVGFTWLAQAITRAAQQASADSRPSRAVGLGIGAIVILASLANQFVLVRLYPAFHWGLSALCLVTSGAGLALAPRTQSKGALASALALLAAALVGFVPLSALAQRLDNFRFVVSDGSELLKTGVLLASRIAPPPPLDLEALRSPLGSRAPRRDLADLTGRSFLLISIDALRADHLGLHGYERPTSPTLDKLGREGVVFDHAYAATPHTSYSLTSLLTGKYMRPLLLQGAGADSDLLPQLLQTYGYRTAAFYPPAVFFVAKERFTAFEKARFGFEYGWVEFAEGEKRVAQVESYLATASSNGSSQQPLFVWVHLFGPHEPYEAGDTDFGKSDADRYDSEIREADETVAALVATFRRARPGGVVIVTADHGEEFGEHGGRYHGTTVYEEQARVPLIWNAEGVFPPGRHAHPVQTIDIMPTLLSLLRIPIPPRVRGRDLSPVLFGLEHGGPGFAAAETESMTLLAEGEERLICARDTGACQLFSLRDDPHQERDLSGAQPELFRRMRELSLAHSASHGAFETGGLRSEGKGLPSALVRGLSGDREVVPDLERLLDDADAALRSKAAELLFELGSQSSLSALRLALSREEDPSVRAHLALALTRHGDTAALTFELLDSPERSLRRRAALALAERGDATGQGTLLDWFSNTQDEAEVRALLGAFQKLRLKAAVPSLVARLDEVRIRGDIARALGKIGDPTARPALLLRFQAERYVHLRPILLEALLDLGAKKELAGPLLTYLGVPEPIPHGLERAQAVGVLESVGGPSARALAEVRRLGDAGVRVRIIVPPLPKGVPNGSVRLLVWGRSRHETPASVRFELTPPLAMRPGKVSFKAPPQPGQGEAVVAELAAGPAREQVAGSFSQLKPGSQVELGVFASSGAEVLGFALVPERPELAVRPTPPPGSDPANLSRTPAQSPGTGL